MGFIKSYQELEEIYGKEAEHPNSNYSHLAWKMRVVSDETLLGYWRWVTTQLVREFEAMNDLQRQQAKKRDTEHLIEIGYLIRSDKSSILRVSSEPPGFRKPPNSPEKRETMLCESCHKPIEECRAEMDAIAEQNQQGSCELGPDCDGTRCR